MQAHPLSRVLLGGKGQRTHSGHRQSSVTGGGERGGSHHRAPAPLQHDCGLAGSKHWRFTCQFPTCHLACHQCHRDILSTPRDTPARPLRCFCAARSTQPCAARLRQLQRWGSGGDGFVPIPEGLTEKGGDANPALTGAGGATRDGLGVPHGRTERVAERDRQRQLGSSALPVKRRFEAAARHAQRRRQPVLACQGWRFTRASYPPAKPRCLQLCQPTEAVIFTPTHTTACRDELIACTCARAVALTCFDVLNYL